MILPVNLVHLPIAISSAIWFRLHVPGQIYSIDKQYSSRCCRSPAFLWRTTTKRERGTDRKRAWVKWGRIAKRDISLKKKTHQINRHDLLRFPLHNCLQKVLLKGDSFLGSCLHIINTSLSWVYGKGML